MTGHTSGDQDLLTRIANGQDGIVHNGFNADNPEAIRSLLDHSTVVDPTPIQSLAAYNAINWPPFADSPRARLLTPPEDLWSEIRGSLDHFERLPYFLGSYQSERYDLASKAIKRLYDSGARLVLGTDSGTPSNYHIDNTWHQMQLYTRFGIPAMSVIAMATRLSAQWLGLGNTTGSIAPGRMADIIVGWQPLTDMFALKDPVYVIKEGVQYKGPAPAVPASKTSSASQR